MTEHAIPNRFYRISAKALVLNDTREKFLLTKMESGHWDLPGGGIDWGELPQVGLAREIMEEMGVATTTIAPHPSYFLTTETRQGDIWYANVLYETTLASLDFTPSDECIDITFVTKAEAEILPLTPNTKIFVEQFDPSRHTLS